MGHNFDQNQLAAMIIGNCEKDADYASLIFNNFKASEFPYEARPVFNAYRDYFLENGELPVRDIMSLVTIKKDDQPDVQKFFDRIDGLEIDNLPASFIREKTDLYRKQEYYQNVILDVADIIEAADYLDAPALDRAATMMKERFELYRPLVESKPQTVASEMEGFLEHIMKINERKVVPTYFPQLDEYLNGGLVEKTLSVLISKTHRRQNSHHVEHGLPSIHEGTQRPVCLA